MRKCKKLAQKLKNAAKAAPSNKMLAICNIQFSVCSQCNNELTCRQFRKFREQIYNEMGGRDLWQKIIGTRNA